MFGRVLQRLQAGKIDSRFNLLRVSTYLGSIDLHGGGGLAGLRIERCNQSSVHQKGGIEAACQLPQRVDGSIGVGGELMQQVLSLGRVLTRKGRRQAELDLECDEILLRPVMEIP